MHPEDGLEAVTSLTLLLWLTCCCEIMEIGLKSCSNWSMLPLGSSNSSSCSLRLICLTGSSTEVKDCMLEVDEAAELRLTLSSQFRLLLTPPPKNEEEKNHHK